MPKVQRDNFSDYAGRMHDAYLKTIYYNYNDAGFKLVFALEWEENARITLGFHEVIYYEGNLNSPWGASPYVFSWRQLDKENLNISSTSVDKSAAMATELLFSSGNILRVLCNSITWEMGC